MAGHIRRLNLDVLKPHVPSIVELAERLCLLDRVSRAHITVIEIDANTETVKVEIIGEGIDFQSVQGEIEAVGATIHSIDQVSAGEDTTPRDERAKGQA